MVKGYGGWGRIGQWKVHEEEYIENVHGIPCEGDNDH